MSGRIMAGDEEEREKTTTSVMMTPTELTIAQVFPRLVGVIVFFSSICMLFMAQKRRDQLFQRLVIGMSVHLLLFSIFFMYGTAAIPSGDIHASGNVGTIATCDLQGFFIFVCEATAIIYYCSFSVYSLVGVLNNFEKAKIIWVEKWIHIVVHIYPLGVAIFFLVSKSFNNSSFGFCYVARSPYGCTIDSDNESEDCERGPSTMNEYRTMSTLLLIRYCFNLVVPTTLMIVLYFMVKEKQEKIYCIHSKTVAIQTIIYLLPIYFTEIPFMIALLVQWNDYEKDKQSIKFGFSIFGWVFLSLFGLGAIFSYIYFSVDRNSNNMNHEINSSRTTSTKEGKEKSSTDTDFIFHPLEIIEDDSNSITGLKATTTTKTKTTTKKSTSKKSKAKYSFNIFDGTNATGGFAEYIYDGDSDDERNDNKQTDHWDSVQNYI